MNFNHFFLLLLALIVLFKAQEQPKKCAEYKEKCIRSSDCCYYMRCVTLDGVGPMCIFLD